MTLSSTSLSPNLAPLHQALAYHSASERQLLENLSNINTSGYRAKTVVPPTSAGKLSVSVSATHKGHMGAKSPDQDFKTVLIKAPKNPSGSNVDASQHIGLFQEAKMKSDLILAVQGSLNRMRGAIIK